LRVGVYVGLGQAHIVVEQAFSGGKVVVFDGVRVVGTDVVDLCQYIVKPRLELLVVVAAELFHFQKLRILLDGQ
jgi:hypothetical protein